MNRSTFRLVLLVSFAHAMVHMFEHALPAVEQMIGEEFSATKAQTGSLGTFWRLPFGLGALLAGWLTDRVGSKKMLIVYLLGCSATAVGVWYAPSWAILFAMMFAMGTFASIYHPAGLTLITKETTIETRGAALGWHGIFGSLGIAAAPFIASIVFSTGAVDWREYYLVLIAPALIIAALLLRLKVSSEDELLERRTAERMKALPESSTEDDLEDEVDIFSWKRFLLLVSAGALSGFVYAAFLHFLPRYLDKTGLRPEGWSAESFRNTLTTITLLCAAVGQGIAGRIASPGNLPKQLCLVLFLNVPPLVWMAFAEGGSRLVATCLLALIHFMNQPIYNSLIAEYVPDSRRSSGYGFSNMMCFGIGAFGPWVAGAIASERMMYLTLGGIALTSSLIASVLLTGNKTNRKP